MGSPRSLRVVLLAGGLLAACARTPQPASGSLTIVQTQPVAKPVPGRENGAIAQEMAALLDRYLVTVDPAGRLVPDAAAFVPERANGGISVDGRTITYHLKPGLHFSDGSPLAAADVAATIDALRDPASQAASRLGLDDVLEARAVAPLVVRVRLARPYAPILLYLCGPGNASVILPASAAATVERSAQPVDVAGAGPYRATAFQAGERIELEANPWYRPTPQIPHLTIRTVAASETAAIQLRSGEADAFVMADPALEPQLAALPGIRTATTPLDGVGALIFNTSSAPVNDAATRRAIVAGLDIAGSVRRVFHGGVPATDAAAGLFLWAYDPHAFPPPVYDAPAAARGLEAQGWHLGSDGKRYRDGSALSLQLIVRADQPSSAALAATFAQGLRAIGVTVSTRQYAIQQWGSPDGPLYRGRFDIAIAQFIAGPDPDLTDQFACGRIPPHGYNKPRYCNPELDRLLARAAATYAVPQRVALYRKAQRILARDLPLVPLYRLVSLDALPVTLHGTQPTPVTPFFRVADWQSSR
jgi:peptide/nickel transport system substrate-binding protein